MRDDLLDAQAAIDWTVAQLPSLNKRIGNWLSENVDIGIEDAPPPATHDIVVALVKSSLPRAFNVEIGAYINVIRTSLDILASTLNVRHSVLNPSDVYFPVARSEAAFVAGTYKGSEFIKRLPEAERRKIEALKPYGGGNEELFLLHDLDITRKHRRLIEIDIRPVGFSVSPEAFRDFISQRPDWTLRANEKTILGLIRKRDRSDGDVKFFPNVTLSESGSIERKPIIAVLFKFAKLSESIISMFDAGGVQDRV